MTLFHQLDDLRKTLVILVEFFVDLFHEFGALGLVNLFFRVLDESTNFLLCRFELTEIFLTRMGDIFARIELHLSERPFQVRHKESVMRHIAILDKLFIEMLDLENRLRCEEHKSR